MSDPNPNRLINLPCAKFLNDALAQLSTENPDAIVIMASTADGKTMLSRYHVSLHDYYIFQGLLQSEVTELLLKLRYGEQPPFSESESEEDEDDEEEEPDYD